MNKIRKAFENIWKVKRLSKDYEEEDNELYYDIFLDGCGCAILEHEELQKAFNIALLENNRLRKQLKEWFGKLAKKEKAEKGCGKDVVWSGVHYECGCFEDLKHQDHIILCPRCKEKSK